MRFIRNILFFNTAAIIVLHTLIPHKHHGEMTFKEHTLTHSNAIGIFDTIRLAFHQDTSNDLNNFTLSEQLYLKTNLCNAFDCFHAICFKSGEPFLTKRKPTTTVLFSIKPKDFLRGSKKLRGPPQLDFCS